MIYKQDHKLTWIAQMWAGVVLRTKSEPSIHNVFMVWADVSGTTYLSISWMLTTFLSKKNVNRNGRNDCLSVNIITIKRTDTILYLNVRRCGVILQYNYLVLFIPWYILLYLYKNYRALNLNDWLNTRIRFRKLELD